MHNKIFNSKNLETEIITGKQSETFQNHYKYFGLGLLFCSNQREFRRGIGGIEGGDWGVKLVF